MAPSMGLLWKAVEPEFYSSVYVDFSKRTPEKDKTQSCISFSRRGALTAGHALFHLCLGALEGVTQPKQPPMSDGQSGLV